MMQVDLEALVNEINETNKSLVQNQTTMNFVEAINSVQKLESFFAGYVFETKRLLMRSHIAAGAVRMHYEGLKKDVHTEHCCIVHGCKYGDDEQCSIVNGAKAQSYTCESCQEM